jgi:predicted dehydrogenase
MDDLRLGLVGASRGLRLAEACRSLSHVRTTAVYDLDRERTDSAAAMLGATPFHDFDAFLESAVDAVVIASPIPAHTAQVSAALAAGMHVLCEVTPCSTLEDARTLVEAVHASDRAYMLAENYCYFTEVELVRRLHQDGRFGEVYYAESDHLIDIRELWRDTNGDLTWRGRGEVGIYSTHSLGPLLTILDDRIETLTALTVPGGKFGADVTQPTMHLIQMTTACGRRMRLRIDLVSPRPPLGAYYALQGTRGSYESWRGLGDRSKVWLEDAHGPSSLSKWGTWQPLDDLRADYLDDSHEPVPGTEGADRRMMADFLAVARGEIASPFDVYRGLDFTLPGIIGDMSAAQGGAILDVPDPRSW